MQGFTSYLRNGWSVNLRAIENCIFSIRSIQRNMRPILRIMWIYYCAEKTAPPPKPSLRNTKECFFSTHSTIYNVSCRFFCVPKGSNELFSIRSIQRNMRPILRIMWIYYCAEKTAPPPKPSLRNTKECFFSTHSTIYNVSCRFFCVPKGSNELFHTFFHSVIFH